MKISMKWQLSQNGKNFIRKTLKFCLYLFIIIGVVFFVFSREGVYICDKQEEYYIDEQIIEDDTLLEGKIERIQYKQPGYRRGCRNLNGWRRIVDKQPTPSIVKIGTKKFKDPQLLAMAPSAGIKHSLSNESVSLYYVDNYTDHIWAAGQYNDYTKAVTVKSSAPLNYQHIILAHEYLHYVWYRDKLDQDIKLVGELTTFYKNSADLQLRMKDYTSDMTKPTEFFSFGCTEFANHHLTQYILQKCDQYIDRSKLKMFYQ